MTWSSEWRRAAGLLSIALLALILIFWNTWSAMVQIWIRSDTFAHAFVVPPISAWLIWNKRHVLSRQRIHPCWPPLLLLLHLCGAWLCGELLSANALTQLAVMCMVPVIVWAVLGRNVSRTLLFPLMFLFFCVPVGEFLVPYMMQGTADFTIAALRWSGVPVYREGLQFIIPSGQWSVVEACSGIRYLIASLMVGTLFAYLNFRSLKRRLLFVLVALVTPLVANWLRAYLIVMLGHLSGNRLATGVDHIIYGWVFFGIVMVAMFMLGARWSEEPSADEDVEADALPSRSDNTRVTGDTWFRLVSMTALIVLIVSTPVLALRQLSQAGTLPSESDWKVDFSSAGWAFCGDAGPEWLAHIVGARLERHMCFEKAGQAVWVQAFYFVQQDYAHKLLSSTNVLVLPDDKHWASVSNWSVQGEGMASNPPLTFSVIREAPMVNGLEQRLLAAQSYWIGGRWLSGGASIRMHGVMDRLLGQGDAAAEVVAYVALRDEADTTASQTLVQQFFRDTQALWSQQLTALHLATSLAGTGQTTTNH